MSQPILRADQLRDLERRHASDHSPLMERAGKAAAELIARLQHGLAAAPLIFAGPGNNGGDGFVAARLLHQRGLRPLVVSRADPGSMPADALRAWNDWRAAGGREHREVPPGRYGVVVDALFGIGLTRPLDGIYGEWVSAINAYGGPILALDCPSGLDANSGRRYGAAVRASHTLTFIALKPGLLTLDGPDHCGALSVADLQLGDEVKTVARGHIIGQRDFADRLHPRRRNSHKGSYGSVAVIGGASGLAGAALLSGRAALKLGAGRVYLGMLERLAIDPGQPELMLRGIDDAIATADVLAVGPGLGDSAAAAEYLRQAIAADKPLLIDADGINLLAMHPSFVRQVARRTAATVLTPHPLEAARLLGRNVDSVQADRVASTLELAARYHADVALKGCGTIVAAASGDWRINTSGNPGLAAAGSGDVLTGFAAALLAQGWPATAALIGAVHLHGAAADRLAEACGGTVGITASELPDAARATFNQWIADA
ncbi:MAG: NAD(P)H-hydrate dehydratase [Rhodocyclaceae bacterium]|jgi:hydroxyethylthiazole kinase-like uncharacterized protein yjeF|nr:NAD(P)H-hydrate dehydratase [Rhodocyclaceae bacterium]